MRVGDDRVSEPRRATSAHECRVRPPESEAIPESWRARFTVSVFARRTIVDGAGRRLASRVRNVSTATPRAAAHSACDSPVAPAAPDSPPGDCRSGRLGSGSPSQRREHEEVQSMRHRQRLPGTDGLLGLGLRVARPRPRRAPSPAGAPGRSVPSGTRRGARRGHWDLGRPGLPRCGCQRVGANAHGSDRSP